MRLSNMLAYIAHVLSTSASNSSLLVSPEVFQTVVELLYLPPKQRCGPTRIKCFFEYWSQLYPAVEGIEKHSWQLHLEGRRQGVYVRSNIFGDIGWRHVEYRQVSFQDPAHSREALDRRVIYTNKESPDSCEDSVESMCRKFKLVGRVSLNDYAALEL